MRARRGAPTVRGVIEVRNITKRFGDITAVDDLSFDVHPGRVTGFLGPNGSGKSTTMRCMLGLDKSQGGEARFGGRSFGEIEEPLHEVGALLDAGLNARTTRKLLERGVADFPDHPDLRQILRRAEAAAGAAGTSAPVD